MSEQSLAEVLHSAAARMKVDFERSKAFRHRGETGTVREWLVKELLDKYLPGQTQAVPTSEIVSADGSRSNQCDVVIADRNAFSLLDMEEYRLIFNEFYIRGY